MYRRPSHSRLIAALAGIAAGLVGCGLLPDSVSIPVIRPDPIYDELFPHYAELCAVDQYRKLDGRLGAFPGHAVMYLRGACRRQDAPFPALEPCASPSPHPHDAAHGTGISVNRVLKNVNWLATPGKSLFLDGDLEPGETLTGERYEATIQRAISLGLFRGVEVHAEWLADAPPGRKVEEHLARTAVGTDYALRFARTLFCTRLPVTAPMMERMIAFLNDLNEQYATGEADYRWSGYHDNCVHTLHNALAAAGVWRRKAVWEIKLRQIFHLAIPANAFIELAERGNDAPIGPWWRIQMDAWAKRTLLEHDWLPTGPGALVKVLPIHEPNDLFDTRHRIFVLEGPLRRARTRQLARMLADARYTDLASNLRHFEALYAAALAGDPADPDADPAGPRSRWRAHVERQLDEVRGWQRAHCERSEGAPCGPLGVRPPPAPVRGAPRSKPRSRRARRPR
jgi:hypothetical protein